MISYSYKISEMDRELYDSLNLGVMGQANNNNDNLSILFSKLTLREKEVLHWMKQGKTNWETGEILNVSENTIKYHLKNIKTKLNAANKHHAVAIAMLADRYEEKS